MNRREKQAVLLGIVGKGERLFLVDDMIWSNCIDRVGKPGEQLLGSPIAEVGLCADDGTPEQVIRRIVDRY